MTYSSIIQSANSDMTAKKSMDIKPPEPIIDAKTMLSFSTLQKLHHKKITSLMAYFFRSTF